MGWENVRAAETYAMATFELCNVLQEVHGLPVIDYREKLNLRLDYYPKLDNKEKEEKTC